MHCDDGLDLVHLSDQLRCENFASCSNCCYPPGIEQNDRRAVTGGTGMTSDCVVSVGLSNISEFRMNWESAVRDRNSATVLTSPAG